MFNKVILIAILLIVGSQANLQDSIDARFAKLVDQYSHNTPAHVQDAKQNVEEFVKGFVSGVASDAFFDQIKQCLADDQEVQHDIMTAIELIKTKNPEKVKEGIKLLGKAVEVIPVAANDCKAASGDIQKFIDLLKSFTDPKSFLYKVGKSLIINHVEVIAEINHIIDAYTGKNYNQIGFWTGKAMATILLGEKNKLRKTMADFINAQNVGWTAEVPEQFSTMTLEDLEARLMPLSMLEDDTDGLTVFDYEGIEQMASILPKNFDGRKKWGKCVHPIRDQAKCGSCWSFASTEVLSDRYCIASKGEIDVILSPQYLVSCNRDNHACQGGSAGITWAFLAERGTVQDQCIPYKSGNGTNPLTCEDIKTCDDGSDLKLYNAIPGSPVRLSNPTSIKINILKYGPAQAGFTVYEDFKLYKGGIYKHVTGKSLGGHAVKIVGWGEEKGTKYWIIANSWTPKWGEEGFFKIAFGECGIDSRITAGQADLNLDESKMSKAKRWF